MNGKAIIKNVGFNFANASPDVFLIFLPLLPSDLEHFYRKPNGVNAVLRKLCSQGMLGKIDEPIFGLFGGRPALQPLDIKGTAYLH